MWTGHVVEAIIGDWQISIDRWVPASQWLSPVQSLTPLRLMAVIQLPPFSRHWRYIFMPPPPTGISGGIMFSSCPSVSACVRPRMRPATRISSRSMNGISPNCGWWRSSLHEGDFVMWHRAQLLLGCCSVLHTSNELGEFCNGLP